LLTLVFRVNNFSKDVSDGENYTILLNQLKPDDCSRAPLQTRDLRQRAEQVLQNAAKIGCRKYLTPASLVAGNPRLNLAFVANLFNTHPGLEPLDEQEAKDYGAVEDFDAEGEREARVFTLWLNSLGVDPAVFNLFENLRDGLVLLQAFDRVYPGVVVWRRVSKPKGGATSPTQPAFYVNENGEEEEVEIGVTPNQSSLSKFKQVENTNYCIELGKQNGMSLVGIQGSDIVDRNKTLVLGYVWQLMRCVITTISSMTFGLIELFAQDEHYKDTFVVVKIRPRPADQRYRDAQVGQHDGTKGQAWHKDDSLVQGSEHNNRHILFECPGRN